MKIIESQQLTLKDAIKYANKLGLNLHYSLLQGILNHTPMRNNTYIIPGTFTQYLRFHKSEKGTGCIVEKIEMCFD